MPHSPTSPGQALAHRFYQRAVAPVLAGTPHAAGLLGDGSEVLGYDDQVSTDHDYGPRVQIFLPSGADPQRVRGAVAAGLPERFEGWPVGLDLRRPAVEVSTAAEFFTAAIGVDPAAGMRLADWLLTPTRRFASLTTGPVFHDPDRTLTHRQAALAWYPVDIWRYVLAAGWLRIGQEQAFIGRTGGTGDELGSAVLTARLGRELIRLGFLVERRWAPYHKWLGRGFGQLPIAAEAGRHLRAALAARRWREREAAVCAAAAALGAATNRLGLAEPVDPEPSQFYSRDIRVVAAERFTAVLTAAITDRPLRGLVDRLGQRAHPAAGLAQVGALPGAIDQAVDSVDILSHPQRCRAAAALLGLT